MPRKSCSVKNVALGSHSQDLLKTWLSSIDIATSDLLVPLKRKQKHIDALSVASF